MGENVPLSPLGVVDNSSFVTELNDKLDTLSREFDNVVYKDGSEEMTGDLNMGSNRIYNLPAAVLSHEPLRKSDLDSLVAAFLATTSPVVGAASSLLGFDSLGIREDIPITDFLTADSLPFITPERYGAVGNSIEDDTVALQEAIDEASDVGGILQLSAVTAYRTTAPLNITKSLRIVGSGVNLYVSTVGSKGPGSWFFFDHLGKGFNVTNSGGLMGGIEFRNFGTYRNQPASAPGWVPLAADYDFDLINSDVLIDNVVVYNPTKAIRLNQGNAGRLTINRLRGQPLSVGIDIQDTYDSFVANDIRWWPFWQNTSDVNTYTLANRKGMIFAHVDNPSVVNYFDIYSRFPIFFTSHVNGITSRGTFVAPYFDLFGEAAVYVEAGANETSFQIVGGHSVGNNSGAAGQTAFYCGANSCQISIDTHRFTNVKTRIATLAGTGSTLIVNSPHVNDWNTANGGHEAFAAAATNRIYLNGKGYYSGGNGAPKINDASVVSSDQWITSTPAVSSTAGTLTSSSSSFKHNRKDDTVKFETTITITTNGTGSGAISIPLPLAAANLTTSIGREVAVGGKSLVASISGSTMTIQNYDNTYPASNGAILVVSGEYATTTL